VLAILRSIDSPAGDGTDPSEPDMEQDHVFDDANRPNIGEIVVA
jgi:hypothetical protein